MGWDSIEFGGEHELFRDDDLWMLRHFFLEEARLMEAEGASDETTKLREFFEGWNWYGTGVVVGTNISDYVGNVRGRWELLLQLLHRAGDRISAFGEFIPLDYLNAAVAEAPGGGCFMRSQAVHRYLSCVGRICSLISKHRP